MSRIDRFTLPSQPRTGTLPFQSMDKYDNPNELFVGNLSFFCDEQDLYHLISSTLLASNPAFAYLLPDELINRIDSIRIIRSANDVTKSLHFGFVTLVNHEDCCTVVKRLNGTMYMGRRLK